MTTATDTLTVAAPTKADAPDIARRQWEGFGFRVLRVLDVVRVNECIGVTFEVPPYRWRVTADVEVVRR